MRTGKERKLQKYRDLASAVEAVLSEEKEAVLWMSTLSCLIREYMKFFWVGFYRVLPGGGLVIGPYQGSLACLRIPLGKGACGLCAARGESIVIPDVETFPPHISCDSRSRSELVIPVKDRAGRVRAVLDIDSTETGTFDSVDREELESIVGMMEGIEWE